MYFQTKFLEYCSKSSCMLIASSSFFSKIFICSMLDWRLFSSKSTFSCSWLLTLLIPAILSFKFWFSFFKSFTSAWVHCKLVWSASRLYKKASVPFDTHDGLPYRCHWWILSVAPGFLSTSCVLAGVLHLLLCPPFECDRIVLLPEFPASFRCVNCSCLACTLFQFCFDFFSPFHFILHVYFSTGRAQNFASDAIARSSQSL